MDGRAARPPAARRPWNRIPPRVRQQVVDLALAVPERTPRELAWQFTDREGHFLSESSVYRILKAFDLITSPAFVVLSAGKVFQQPTHRPNELWQTDFTYLHVGGWGWYYLSTVLDDYSRYILAWTLRTSMQATDVMEKRPVPLDFGFQVWHWLTESPMGYSFHLTPTTPPQKWTPKPGQRLK